MTTEYKNENDVEEIKANQPIANVTAPIEQMTQQIQEEKTEDKEELFFWSEPGVCG